MQLLGRRRCRWEVAGTVAGALVGLLGPGLPGVCVVIVALAFGESTAAFVVFAIMVAPPLLLCAFAGRAMAKSLESSTDFKIQLALRNGRFQFSLRALITWVTCAALGAGLVSGFMNFMVLAWLLTIAGVALFCLMIITVSTWAVQKH